MIPFNQRKGITLISSGWCGQTRFLRTIDTDGLELVPCPFNRFQVWLGRFMAQLR